MSMKRREFIALLGGAAAWPLAAQAQQVAMPVIGILSREAVDASAHIVAAFRRGLNAAGYDDGQNVALACRWAVGQNDRLPRFAADFVRRSGRLIVALDNMAAVAAREATAKIAVVFATRGGPVPLELVSK